MAVPKEGARRVPKGCLIFGETLKPKSLIFAKCSQSSQSFFDFKEVIRGSRPRQRIFVEWLEYVAECLLFFAKFYRLHNTFHVWKNALECLSKFEKCFRVLCKEFATRFEKWFRVRCTFREVV